MEVYFLAAAGFYIFTLILLTLTAAGKNQKNMLESKAGLMVIRPAWLEIHQVRLETTGKIHK